MMTINEIVAFAFHNAKAIIEEGQEHTPMFLIVTPDAFMPVAAPWRNNSDKELIYQAIHNLLIEHKAQMYAHICEAWTVDLEPGQKWNGVMPSASPNRVECLTISAYDTEGRSRILVAKIRGEGKNRRVQQPEFDITDSLATGAAVDLFLPRDRQR